MPKLIYKVYINNQPVCEFYSYKILLDYLSFNGRWSDRLISELIETMDLIPYKRRYPEYFSAYENNQKLIIESELC
jgi:hypothetical protein